MKTIQVESGSSHGTLSSYLAGFSFSIILTLGAYLAVTHPLLPRTDILIAVVGFGFLQLAVQLVFFLHLDRESNPRWNAMILGFALIMVSIITGGSIWIMSNLRQHSMSPMDTNAFIMKDEGVRK